VDLTFSGVVWFWKGPAPHYFVTLPEAESLQVKSLASRATYGWGMIPVDVRVGATEFYTALFEKEGRYILPLRAAVRKAEGIGEGDTVSAWLSVRLH
jgi:hypothetical protein